MQSSAQQKSFQLQTDDQKSALAALKPVSVGVESFHQLVLNMLDIISRPHIYYGSKRRTVNRGPSYSVSRTELREYRRAAKSAERMADQLAKDVAKLQGLGFPRVEIPSAPIRQLKEYANLLKEHADADEPYVARPPLRRRKNKNTNDIIALVRFVEQVTGKPHWNRLAVLVQAAVGDKGFNEDRLRKIVKYHEKKSRKP